MITKAKTPRGSVGSGGAAVRGGAGRAGGSADAAGVLVGLTRLYDARLSMSELCALGASIGADVPFALLGLLVKDL